jgi:hypothetical protein
MDRQNRRQFLHQSAAAASVLVFPGTAYTGGETVQIIWHDGGM